MKPRIELHQGRWRVAHQPGALYACNDLKQAREWCTMANFRKRAWAECHAHNPQMEAYYQAALAAGYSIHRNLERNLLRGRP